MGSAVIYSLPGGGSADPWIDGRAVSVASAFHQCLFPAQVASNLGHPRLSGRFRRKYVSRAPPGVLSRSNSWGTAWQFLNSTADPRLSMIERAAAALGIRVADVLKLRKPRYLQAAERGVATLRAVALVYASAAVSVAAGKVSKNEAVNLLTKGTDAAMAGESPEAIRTWDRWRLRTGQRIHASGLTTTEYIEELRRIAEELRIEAASITESTSS